MYDSPLHDFMPGDVKVFGWPWHGRLDGEKGLTLTLPNGDVITAIGKSLTVTKGIQRFRDPRAKATPRTEDEQGADLAAGISWRPDVLFDYRLGLVHGSTEWADTVDRAARWIYSDGSTVWMASLFRDSDGPKLKLVPAPAITRDKSNQYDNEALWKTITLEVDADDDAMLSGFTIADAKLDGSSAIFSSGGLAYNNYDTRGRVQGAPVGAPAYWFELSITHSLDEETQVSTHEAKLSQINRGFKEERSFDFALGDNAVKLDFVTQDFGNTSMVSVVETIYNDSFQIPEVSMVYRVGRGIRNNFARSTNAAIGYFYNEEQVATPITLDWSYTQSHTNNGLEGSGTGSPAVYTKNPDTGEVVMTDPGYYNYSGACHSVLEITSEVKISCGEYSTSTRAVTKATMDSSVSIAMPTVNSSPEATYSYNSQWTQLLEMNGVEIKHLSGSDSGADVDSLAYPVEQSIYGARFYDGSWYTFFPISYAPNIAAPVMVEFNSSDDVISNTAGNVLYFGRLDDATKKRAGAFPSEVYGAFNPIDEELIRDSSYPVSFI